MTVSHAALHLGTALMAAQALTPGVYVCMGGRAFPLGQVRKDAHTGQFVSTSPSATASIGSPSALASEKDVDPLSDRTDIRDNARSSAERADGIDPRWCGEWETLRRQLGDP